MPLIPASCILNSGQQHVMGCNCAVYFRSTCAPSRGASGNTTRYDIVWDVLLFPFFLLFDLKYTVDIHTSWMKYISEEEKSWERSINYNLNFKRKFSLFGSGDPNFKVMEKTHQNLTRICGIFMIGAPCDFCCATRH